MSQSAAETLSRLLESLQPYPRMRFLLFSGSWGPLEEALYTFARHREHEILLYTLGEGVEEAIPGPPTVQFRPYRIEQPRYNLRGRLYNHAFVFGTVPDDPASFARKIYTGIANAGGLYLRLARKSGEDQELWERTLLESNYVAPGTLDLDDESQLLCVRKMHGWGG